MFSININCDLGEGGGDDAEIMSLISSCNIACGGHYGDMESVAKAVSLAKKQGTNIGAHPSYPDKENFGRAEVDISLRELEKLLRNQIKLVIEESKRQNVRLTHVKPHGKLYNDLKEKTEKAKMIIRLVCEIDDSLILFVPPKSEIKKMAKDKLKTYTEVFADRNYKENFELVSRKENDALLTKKEEILKRILYLVNEKKITLKSGKLLKVNFDTICLHPDTPNCLKNLVYLNRELPKNNIEIIK